MNYNNTDIIQKVENFIHKEKLLPANGRLLLAVSGGVDSVVMLDIYLRLAEKLGLTLAVAHLNHCLRGEDSLRDEAFVRKLAQASGLAVVTERIDVADHAHKNKQGVEEAARELRYAFLRGAARLLGCGAIALAHHMDDNAESILLGIARGAGLTGLAGIRPRREDGTASIVRPLLCLERAEIEAYAQAAGLAHVTDHTNASVDFQRNRVRHVLLPELRGHFNPQIVRALARLGEIARTENAWADGVADTWLTDHASALDDGLAWDATVFRALPPALAARVLRQAIKAVKGDLRCMERQHIEQIMALAANPAPLKRLDLPDRLLAVKRSGTLELRRMSEPLRTVVIS